uniref:Uncharacterized protein n=1 Tax=Heterorhabditis bacteriophora TaxID=37862 RepID=A0A1I7WQV0_HETBA
MSLPRPKKQKEIDADFFKSATLRPNRRNTATVRRLSVISMSSRVAISPLHGNGTPLNRQVKKVSMPVVPNMVVVNGHRNEDVNRNIPSNMSYRSTASPSRLSDDRNSDTQNGNRNSRPNVQMNSSSFCSYGTEAGQLLGTKNCDCVISSATYRLFYYSSSYYLKIIFLIYIQECIEVLTLLLCHYVHSVHVILGMTSLTFPSTSILPVEQSYRVSTGSNSSQGSSGFESMKSHGTTSSHRLSPKQVP